MFVNQKLEVFEFRLNSAGNARLLTFATTPVNASKFGQINDLFKAARRSDAVH
jgi:hypothetical protein